MYRTYCFIIAITTKQLNKPNLVHNKPGTQKWFSTPCSTNNWNRFRFKISCWNCIIFFFWCKYSTISSDFQIGPADVSANGTGKLLSLFLQFETLLLLVPHIFATSLRASSSLSITIQSSLLISFTRKFNIVHILHKSNIHYIFHYVNTKFNKIIRIWFFFIKIKLKRIKSQDLDSQNIYVYAV